MEEWLQYILLLSVDVYGHVSCTLEPLRADKAYADAEIYIVYYIYRWNIDVRGDLFSKLEI